MKGDMLGYTCCLYPVLQRCLEHAVFQSREHLVSRLAVLIFVIEAYEFKCLLADWVIDELLGLLHTDGDVHASVAVWLYLLPGKFHDIALAESCETCEQERLLQFGFLTLGLCQFHMFWLCEMFLFGGDGINLLQIAVRILQNLVVTIGGVKHGTEG